MSNPTCYHLSASSVAAFKACPTRFRLGYREGLRPAVDTDAQRMGTNWHRIHEVYHEAYGRLDPAQFDEEQRREHGVECVVEHLNAAYENKPESKTLEEWAVERQTLLASFIGYLWFHSNDPIEVLASEVPFDLPVHAPQTGLPLLTSEVLRVGKIDHLIRWQGGVCVLERKSTGSSIVDGDYWVRSQKDTQVSMYALALRDLRAAGLLPVEVGDDERFGNTLYDVWHKPGIKPKLLTQAETATLVETGEYCGQSFEVVASEHGGEVLVNGWSVEVKPGKKGFAIRESPEMYGARLLEDIYERPDHYFARREIARTDSDIRTFRSQLYAVYQAQRAFSREGCWFENEGQCRATFPCVYIPICYGPGSDAVCDGQTTPPGFKRIFVDLRVNGQLPEE